MTSALRLIVGLVLLGLAAQGSIAAPAPEIDRVHASSSRASSGWASSGWASSGRPSSGWASSEWRLESGKAHERCNGRSPLLDQSETPDSPAIRCEGHRPADDHRLQCSWSGPVAGVLRSLYPSYQLVEIAEEPQSAGSLVELRFESYSSELPPLRISLSDHSFPNAYAVPGLPDTGAPDGVVLTRGLLEQLRSRSELAFVLAHEISHVMHGHFPGALPAALMTPAQRSHIAAVHKEWEYSADADALERLRQSGFDPNGALAVLARLSRFEEEDEPAARRHPELDQRLSALYHACGRGAGHSCGAPETLRPTLLGSL